MADPARAVEWTSTVNLDETRPAQECYLLNKQMLVLQSFEGQIVAYNTKPLTENEHDY